MSQVVVDVLLGDHLNGRVVEFDLALANPDVEDVRLLHISEVVVCEGEFLVGVRLLEDFPHEPAVLDGPFEKGNRCLGISNLQGALSEAYEGSQLLLVVLRFDGEDPLFSES